MWFLSPWMLYGLGGLAAPIFIHLWKRRRVIQVPFGTLRFLKIAQARTRRSSRIENVLLLLLRCALFALLALAAARPVLARKSSLGSAPRSVALVLDDSMSMGYRTGEQTRLDAARKEALAVLDNLKAADQVAVLAANDRAEPLIPELTVDHAAARKAIGGIRQTDGRADFSQALTAARKTNAREIYLFTDNQANGWRTPLAPGANLVIVKPDDLPSPNAAVMKAALLTPFANAGSPVQGVATVENFSSDPLHTVLEIDLAGVSVTRKPVDLGPNASADVPFEFEMPAATGKSVAGAAKIEADNLPADDLFNFIVPLYQPPNVLIVENGNAGFYLRKAMEGAPRTIPETDLDDVPVEGYSAIFLAGLTGLSDRAVVKMDRFLDAGGTVVFFPGDATNIGGLSRVDFLPKAGAVRDPPAGRLSSRVEDPANPLFANVWDDATPFPALPQTRMADWNGGKTLLTAGGVPFLISTSRGAGRVFVVNASADRTWGDFPLSPAFLPLVQQMLRTQAPPPPAPANSDRGESDLRTMDPAALPGVDIITGMDGLKTWLASVRGLSPLWPLLLLLALVVFLAETFLANRLARNRAETGRIQTGRLNKRSMR